MSQVIDINADAGESFGRWNLGDDASFLPHVSSVNVACGFHAGDPTTMRQTVRIAKQHRLGVGVHPGFPDLLGFGRRMMSVSHEELVDYTLYQTGALTALAAAEGMKVVHVKPHGAFYKALSLEVELSSAMGRAIASYDPSLILVLLAGAGADAAERAGARVAREAFIDLDYDPDGSLIIERIAKPRDPAAVAKRAVKVVQQAKLAATNGHDLNIRADTLCLHGDRANSAEVAKAVKDALAANGIRMAPLQEVMKKACHRNGTGSVAGAVEFAPLPSPRRREPPRSAPTSAGRQGRLLEVRPVLSSPWSPSLQVDGTSLIGVPR